MKSLLTGTPPSSIFPSLASLSTNDGHLDMLAVADYISTSVNAGIAYTAGKVFGYNLEFKVCESGAVLITGASGKIGG